MRQTTKIWVVPLDDGMDQVKLVHNLSSGRKHLYINEVFAQSYANEGTQGNFFFNIGRHDGQLSIENDITNGYSYLLNIDGTIIENERTLPLAPEPDIKIPDLVLPDEEKNVFIVKVIFQ